MMLRQLAFLLIPLLGVLLLISRSAVADVEEPAYRVLEKDGAFELRQYPALLAAETVVTGAGFEDAGNVAFGRLFRYISGNNRSQEKVAMTAPVVQSASQPGEAGEKIAMTAPVIQQAQPAGAPGYRVAFLVPAGYTADTVPEPLDPEVRIVSTPARLVAAVTFAGRLSSESHAEQEAALRAAIKARGLVVAGETVSAQYNAPFIPGPFRRNEVLIPVSRN